MRIARFKGARPGSPFPLGASWDGEGVNFSIFSQHATGVELLLFRQPDDHAPFVHHHFKQKTGHVWHSYLPGIGPGTLYFYRIHGPYKPRKGHRFNPAKAVIDPYSRALAGGRDWDDSFLGYQHLNPEADLARDSSDSAPHAPKGVVIDPAFDWEDDRRPRTPWEETVIYEVHVKGATASHPEVEEGRRGTYSGLASPPMIDYYRSLGITALELLPVHHRLNEKFLLDKGLSNYWGYSTLNYFSPDSRFASPAEPGAQVAEFKEMVKKLHRAGIEVILDVVYNHTAEGNHLGPTLSFRGADNLVYYRLVPNDLRHYLDFTGTGNSLNTIRPATLHLIMDSLRYWVEEMRVDGFRFDLAVTLGREPIEFTPYAAFFDAVYQDPVLSRVKLIAEPWDIGPHGYAVGLFPHPWSEWNDKYRNTVRRFWKGDEGHLPDFARRLSGSADLYHKNGMGPRASINYVTAHDGFTLADLVSYDRKHNEANLENGADGHNENLCWNCGAEGPSDDPGVLSLRRRQAKNFLATLLLSQGVPMILGGDEIGRTQKGNNNAYCQDNEISWFDWNLDENRTELKEFTRRLIRFRKDHPVFRQSRFFTGRKAGHSRHRDVTWLRADGKEMRPEDWAAPFARTIGMLLCGDAMDEVDERGNRVSDGNFLVLFNAHHEPVSFVLPETDTSWKTVLSTADDPNPAAAGGKGEPFRLEGRSLAVLEEAKAGNQ